MNPNVNESATAGHPSVSPLPGPAPAEAGGTVQGSPRRNFLVAFWAAAISGLVGVVPVVAGVVHLLDPILRKKSGGGTDDGFVEVASLDALPENGVPQQFTVTADFVDAWTALPNRPLGAVYLHRVPGTDEVQAFNVICPHLGCSVEYRSNDEEYYFPCHESAFKLDGSRKNSIPPRGLDSLEVAVRDGNVWVKFENFIGGREEKIPVS